MILRGVQKRLPRDRGRPYIQSEICLPWKHHSLILPWWRHEMETFSALLAICAGNSPVPGELPTQRPVTRSFDVFFDLCLNKPLSNQSWGWWFETLSCPLWRHYNALIPSTCPQLCTKNLNTFSAFSAYCFILLANEHDFSHSAGEIKDECS